MADTSIAGETCAAENIYYFATYSLEALQGVLIALGFCYLNSEVRTCICLRIYIRTMWRVMNIDYLLILEVLLLLGMVLAYHFSYLFP